jgi:O-antigen ligase
MLALLFVLVQVAGESLRLPLMPLSVAQTAFVIVLLFTAAKYILTNNSLCYFSGLIDSSLFVFSLWLFLSIIIGLYSNASLTSIKNDLVPLFVLIASYMMTRLTVRDTLSMRIVIGGILFGSTVAALKLLFIAVYPVVVNWNGPWQAQRITEGYGIIRVILNGADMFFVVSAIFVLVVCMIVRVPGRFKVLTGILAVIGVVLSGTRSNWVGLVIGLIFVGIIAVLFSLFRWRRVFLVGTIGVILLVTVVTLSPSLKKIASDAGASIMSRERSLVVRFLENQSILSEINKSVVFGNGMGSTYEYFGLSDMVSAQWSHNGFLMLILKIGILGLMLFLFVVYCVIQLACRLVRAGHPWQAELLGLIGAIVAVLVLSIGVNKIFSFSGSMFLGAAFAIVQSANRIRIMPRLTGII